MKKVFLIYLVLLINSVCILAQIDSIYLKPNTTKKYQITFETGTSIASFKGAGNVGSVYFAPGLKLSPLPKLNLEIKTVFNNPAFNSFSGSIPGQEIMMQQNQYVSIYAEGEYQFSKRLHMKGRVYSNGGNQSNYSFFLPGSSFYQYMYGIQNAYSFGLFYDITNNLQIGAEFLQIQYAPMYPYIY